MSHPYRLDPREAEAIYQAKVLPDVFAGSPTLARPALVFVGGQPGAGKGSMVVRAERTLERTGSPVIINGDALRERHPRYVALAEQHVLNASALTNEDVSGWTRRIIEEARRRRTNTVIDATFNNPERKASEAEFQTMRRVQALVSSPAPLRDVPPPDRGRDR